MKERSVRRDRLQTEPGISSRNPFGSDTVFGRSREAASHRIGSKKKEICLQFVSADRVNGWGLSPGKKR